MRKSKFHYIFTLFIGVAIFLSIDSPYFSSYIPSAQNLTTFLVLIVYVTLYKRSSKRFRTIMLVGVGVGFAGEFFLSLILGMYHYRLENIPLWVGFGHSLIFASVHKIIRIPYILKHHTFTLKILLSLIVIYATAWLILKNDIFGFATTLMFLLLLAVEKKSQMFFTVMYIIVAYIELVGTATGTWQWPTIFMGRFDSIPSANPPSGIAFFYFLFDYIVLFIYLQLNPKLKKRYQKQ